MKIMNTILRGALPRKAVMTAVIALFLLGAVFSSSAQSEVTSIWSRLYQKATTLDRKMIMMSNIVEQHDRNMVPVMVDALVELNEGRSHVSSITDQLVYNDLVRMIVRELGHLKASEAMEPIKRVWDESEDNFLKAEAITALGRINAREYSHDIAMLLRNINIHAIEITDIPQENSIVLACIFALERIKKEDGFEPVFFAAIGDYNRSVTEKANRALTNIVPDPSAVITTILEKEPYFGTKLKALEVENASTASAENKTAVAVIALDQGLSLEWSDRGEQTHLINIRLLAMEMISTYDPNNAEGIAMISSILTEYKKYTDSLFSISEMINVLISLGQSSSDAASLALSDFLMYLTERKDSGYTYQDDRIIRQTIISLGNTGNDIGIAALSEAAYGETWSNSLRREAKASLQKLQN